MAVTLEKIDIIMERANITYEEAKEALAKSEGDLVEALIQLERNEKIKKDKKKVSETINETSISFFDKIKSFLKKVHSYKLKIKKGDELFLSIPMTIVSLIIIFTFPFSLIVLAILVVLGYRIKIKRKNDTIIDVNDIIENK